ncbi:Cadherin-23 [Nymphon striatum]|nr:Cadherin-23 [Nymphon striatum]
MFEKNNKKKIRFIDANVISHLCSILFLLYGGAEFITLLINFNDLFLSFIFPNLNLDGMCNGQTNRSPSFLPGHDMSDFSISENTPLGSLAYTLRGQDPDNKPLNYYISGDSFSVDQDTGAVKLISKLDREAKDTIQVIITLTDQPVSGVQANTVSVRRQITVIDENDNAPIFQNAPYSFFVGETVAVGSVVFDSISVTDEDDGKNSKLKLSCVVEQSFGSCDVFEVQGIPVSDGKLRGEILVKNKLNYELQSSYDLVIMAEDEADKEADRLRSFVKVSIKIKDVQDQPPTFLNDPYSATLKENSFEGIELLTITAKDGDEGDPRPILITIHEDPKGHFKVGKTVEVSRGMYSAPLLTSSIPINREDRDILNNGGLYTIQMKASELINGKPSGDFVITNVTVVVADVDDQYPVFNGREYSVDVKEGISSNTPLSGLNIVIWDNDVGKNAQFSLSLKNIENAEGVFSVYPETAVGRTPVIIKLSDSSKLDYEKPSKRVMKFQVIASQEKNRASTATVTVNVLDANDNGPKFEKDQYVVKVSEFAKAGTNIFELNAEDADSGDFGQLTYSLKGFGSEKFTVEKDAGIIRLGPCQSELSCIDYEMKSVYSLTYSAKDGGGRVATVNLIIEILDENDNYPQFVHEEYHRQIQENTIEINPPLIIKATDVDGPDQGGGVIHYSIETVDQLNQSSLVIDSNTGQVTLVRPFHYAELPIANGNLKFVVIATDAGKPAKSTRVNLHIRKENDGNPVFTNEPYSAHVKENSKPGTSVIQVIATDPDGPDSAITYFISKGARDNFVIGDNTGVISIAPNANLDIDQYGDEFKITIQAVDSGSPAQQTATATVTVHIIDVNNKAPNFPKESYTQYVNERTEMGEKMLSVSANDADLDAKIRYTIIEPITVRDKTGLLIDAAHAKKYKNSFRINGTSGELYVNDQLDYNAAAVYIFKVQAIDLNAVIDDKNPSKKQTAETEVTIYIQAYDNKNPVFAPPWTSSNPTIEITIAEEPAIESELLTLSAKDPVSGNEITNFEEIPGSDPGDYVSISPLSGIVTLNRRLDYEALPLKYISFKVIASSDSQSSRTSIAVVKVNIEDINDNSPVFAQNMYKTSILESAKFPQSIVTVLASDEDSEGNYGNIKYSLSGQGSELFSINPISCTKKKYSSNFRVLFKLEMDQLWTEKLKDSYSLQVTATDNPGSNVNQRKTSVILMINIVDVNDNVPEFTRDTYTAVVPENVPKDISITRVVAHDKDEGNNGLTYYEMLQENDAKGLFKVLKADGGIFVRSSLAGKGRSEPYKITVRATDKGQIPQSNEVDLLIFVGDVATNDGVPQFIKPAVGQFASVYENSTVGTSVYQVVAVDPDNPSTANGKVAYRFLEDTNNRDGISLFSIDPVTGVITTKQNLDRETKQQYALIIVAYDLGDNPQEASRVLDVIVLDVDDNKPRFDRPLDNIKAAEMWFLRRKLRISYRDRVTNERVLERTQTSKEFLKDIQERQLTFLGHCIRKEKLKCVALQGRFNADPIQISVTEESSIGSIAGFLEAHDEDEGENALIDYHIVDGNAEGIFGIRRTIDNKGEIFTKKRIDREEKSSYLLTVKVCKPGDFSKLKTVFKGYAAHDFSEVRIKIEIDDIDDNQPVFEQISKVLGVRVDTELHSELVTLVAKDLDYSSGKMQYFIHNITFSKYGNSREESNAFVIDKDTGVVRTNKPYGAYLGGSFTVSVGAAPFMAKNDTNSSATTSIKFHVVKDTELMKFIFSKPPAEVRKAINSLKMDLKKTIKNKKLSLNLYDSHYYSDGDGRLDLQSTSSCFQLIEDQDIIDPQRSMELLDHNANPDLVQLYQNYSVVEVQRCAHRQDQIKMSWVEISLIAIAIFVAIMALLSAVVLSCLYCGYKRKLKKAAYYKSVMMSRPGLFEGLKEEEIIDRKGSAKGRTLNHTAIQ